MACNAGNLAIPPLTRVAASGLHFPTYRRQGDSRVRESEFSKVARLPMGLLTRGQLLKGSIPLRMPSRRRVYYIYHSCNPGFDYFRSCTDRTDWVSVYLIAIPELHASLALSTSVKPRNPTPAAQTPLLPPKHIFTYASAPPPTSTPA